MKPRFLIPCMIIIFIIIAGPAPCRAVEDSVGTVNWPDGYVTGIGYGTAEPSGNKAIDKLKAMRAARVVAQRHLLENIKGVRIDSVTTIENMMVQEDVIKSRVEGTIKGAEVFRRHFEWVDGNIPLATVEMRVCMVSRLGGCNSHRSLISTLNLNRNYTCPPLPKLNDKNISQPQSSTTPDFSYDSTKPVTGVIITLDGQYFERVLLPVVAAPGKGTKQMTIYSVKCVEPKIVRTYGIARYADTVQDARKIKYLGNNIMIIPALHVTNDNVVIIGKDAARVIKETTRYGNNYLEKARLAIASD